MIHRRQWLSAATAGCMLTATGSRSSVSAQRPPSGLESSLRIVDIRITPIALPDPPILAASGCHGPYFLRNIIELKTDSGITGIGETHGGSRLHQVLEASRELLIGQSAFAYRRFAPQLRQKSNAGYSGIELACLDAVGRATGRRVCELLGGPVRDRVEFAAYLFFRYAADHARVLDDPRLVDARGRGDQALDGWGDVRTPESMAEMAWQMHEKWGFRVQKLKAGVLPPDVELAALREISRRFDGQAPLRIDPNGRWTEKTAIRIGDQLHRLPLEYYEDPVSGQIAMARVREKTDLVMSTNSCVTAFQHIPRALQNKPIDVVLGDHHGWGGITAFQELGRVAETVGWGLSQHSNNHAGVTMSAMIHAGAATPQLNFASDTHYIWLADGEDIIEGANLPIREGQMEIPARPGLGVELDQDKLARAHERFQKCGMRARDDTTTMRRFEPGWERQLF